MRQLIRTYTITGQHEITITGYTFTKQDIRLIIDETLASSATSDSELVASVLVSSTKKANVVSVVNGIITLTSTTANLTDGDELTIEIDIDNIAKTSDIPTVLLILNGLAKSTDLPTDYAKLGSDSTATNTAIKNAIDNLEVEDPNSQALAQFFGLPEALPEIEVATEQEVKDINDDVWGALYGYGKVTVTIHSLMRIGTAQNSENAQSYVTQDLASVIYVDPEKTWSANGYPTLYDDEGTAIDTTTNPTEGDEVFNYQIQSES